MFRRFFFTLGTAVAALGLACGAAQASAPPSVPRIHKDSIACGSACFSLFSDTLGSSLTQNAFVPGDNGTGGKAGQKINLHVAANNRPNGDFFVQPVGRVLDFCGFFANDFFSPTSWICLNEPFFYVFEANWAPNGSESGLCAGVAAAVNGENVTLQPCGVTAKTLWVAERSHATLGGDCRIPATPPVSPGSGSVVNFCPWANAGDGNFSNPLVLTLDTGTTRPTDQLKLTRELLHGGVASSNQQFAFFIGPVS